MSRTFRANCGSLLNLNDSRRCGCSLCFFQMRCTVAELTFCTAAMARTLQCVASLGVVFIVASTMAASRSTEIRLGRPLRGRSSRMPAMPSFSNRFRHNSTVGTDVDSLRASTRLASPSAAPSTILMRSTMPRGELRCRLSAINCLRSASLTVSPAEGGSGISTSSMQAPPVLVKLFQIQETRVALIYREEKGPPVQEAPQIGKLEGPAEIGTVRVVNESRFQDPTKTPRL